MQFRYSIFGESHGPAIGVVLENLPSGIPVKGRKERDRWLK